MIWLTRLCRSEQPQTRTITKRLLGSQHISLATILSLEPYQATLHLAPPCNILGYQPASSGLPQISIHAAVRGRNQLPVPAKSTRSHKPSCLAIAEDDDVTQQLETWAQRCCLACHKPRSFNPWACTLEGMAYCRTRFVGEAVPPVQLLQRCKSLEDHAGVNGKVRNELVPLHTVNPLHMLFMPLSSACGAVAGFGQSHVHFILPLCIIDSNAPWAAGNRSVVL